MIAGPKAQYKGSGEVNGGGDVDTFRIKVWDTLTEQIVYDNQHGRG